MELDAKLSNVRPLAYSFEEAGPVLTVSCDLQIAGSPIRQRAVVRFVFGSPLNVGHLGHLVAGPAAVLSDLGWV